MHISDSSYTRTNIIQTVIDINFYSFIADIEEIKRLTNYYKS